MELITCDLIHFWITFLSIDARMVLLVKSEASLASPLKHAHGTKEETSLIMLDYLFDNVISPLVNNLVSNVPYFLSFFYGVSDEQQCGSFLLKCSVNFVF